MTSRTRFWVLVVSTPVIAFALIGGYLGQAMTRDDTYRNLAIFGDVFDLVVDNYVEDVDVQKAMRGALRGLADGLDSDTAYLTADLVRTFGSSDAQPAEIGVDVTRQYYLRIISARDGSPAAKAGLRTGDYIRAIDGRATRDMSAYEGARLLRGPNGSKVNLLVIRSNAPAEPHEITLVRERPAGTEVTSRMVNPATGYVRLLEFSSNSPSRLKQAFEALEKTGATRYVLDLRGTSRGDLDEGVAAARLFVKSGTLAVRQTKTGKEVITAQASDGSISAPVVLVVDQGTTGAAEVFAAALDGNSRADLVGERTLGRAARQQLVKLPDGSGLLLSSMRYLTPSSQAIHEKGLTPDLQVDQPDVEFGADAPTADSTLEKAIERISK
jgi:carboxyl-terminal processing protease